jgi:hypothetical protein
MKKIFAVLFVLALVAMVVMPVMAQTATPPALPTAATLPAQTTPTAETLVIDAALLLAITAFFKTQLKLTGYWVMGAAFVVGLILYLEPNIVALFPAAASWFGAVLGYLNLWLGAMGTYDFFKSDPPKTV